MRYGVEIEDSRLSHLLHHQSVVIAVAVEVSSALEAESALSISLRVKLHHLKLVGCHVGQKGYVLMTNKTLRTE